MAALPRSALALVALFVSCGGQPARPAAPAPAPGGSGDEPSSATPDEAPSAASSAEEHGALGVLPEKTPAAATPPPRSSDAAMRPLPTITTPPIEDASSGPLPAELAKAGEHLAAKRLADAKREIDAVLASAGPRLDLELQALVLRGRLHRAAKNTKPSDQAYDAIVAARADAEAWAKKEATAGAPERAAFVIQALSEALFVVAERERKRATSLVRPTPQGNLGREEMLRFVNTEIKRWLTDKRQALEAADKAFLELLSIQPAPSPGWVVAASSRSAGMWATFVHEFRTVPAPREWHQKGVVPGTELPYAELLETYRRALFDASAPQLEQARAAYRMCRDHATRFQIEDAFSRGCAEWLRLDEAP